MIKVVIRPNETFSKEEFLKDTEPYSIGLDGAVDSPTFRIVTERGPWANFDHHSGVDRLSTRATSAQVHLEINMGLFKTFSDRGPKATVWINDVDQDVCLAVWLLQNNERVINHADPIINRLVYTDEILDATGGAYPFSVDAQIRRELDWIFEPYLMKRFSGSLRQATAFDLRTILEAVCYRITQYTLGRGEQIDLLGDSKIITTESYKDLKWSILVESGPKARMLSFIKNDAFIAHLSTRTVSLHGDKTRYDYTLARRSVWIPFPIPELYDHLNTIDVGLSEINKWGGSDIIGGSPRKIGSSFSPEVLKFEINKFLSTR